MDIKKTAIVTAIFDIGRDKWDNFTMNLANKECYKFQASHSFTTKLGKALIDENKNVMYYG